MLPGKITIGRPHPGDYINIEVIDEASGVEFVEIHVKYEQFAQLITGLSHVECEFDLRPKYVGMRREHKEEIVPDPGLGWRPTKEQIDAVFAPFEYDGWKGSYRDWGNHHRRAGNGGYRVTFTRYVDDKADDSAEDK